MQHWLISIHLQKVVFMAQGKGSGLSTEQRIEMWRRWKAGESLPITRLCVNTRQTYGSLRP
jgi:hypothetical protein